MVESSRPSLSVGWRRFCPVGSWRGLEKASSPRSSCPWSKQTFLDAVSNRNLELLKWLRSQDPPCPWSKKAWLDASATSGDLEILQWLRSAFHIPSGKFYIGQTINSVWERFIQHWRIISRKEGGRDYKRAQFHRLIFQSPLHNFRVGPWKKLTRKCI